MNRDDARVLNEALATINHNVNALHGRVAALMAYVAELPGASEVDAEKVKANLGRARLSPVETSRSPHLKPPHASAADAIDAIHHRAQMIAQSRQG